MEGVDLVCTTLKQKPRLLPRNLENALQSQDLGAKATQVLKKAHDLLLPRIFSPGRVQAHAELINPLHTLYYSPFRFPSN